MGIDEESGCDKEEMHAYFHVKCLLYVYMHRLIDLIESNVSICTILTGSLKLP